MNWLENMILRSKLIVLTVVMIIGLLIVGAIGFSGISQWSHDMNTFGQKRMPIMIALSELNRERMSIRAQSMEAWKYQNDAGATEGFQKIIDARNKSWKTVDKYWKTVDEFKPSSENGKVLKADLVPAYKEWREFYVSLDTLLAKLATPHDAATHAALFITYNETVVKMVPISDKMGKLMSEMGENNQNNTVAMIEDAMSQSSSKNSMMLVTISIVLVLGILLAILIIRSITRSITTSVTSIRDGAMQITSASDEVASSSSALAEGASQQASSVEEVSAT
ncbi:MAG: MCP four helix bundle domain-containing protein, partial [Sulfuricurvum sp.]